ncbi:MobH family relaxase, partial [Cupriavidus basilensis]
MVPSHAPAPASPYASTDPGFPATPMEDLLAAQAEMLGRIKLCYGSDQATFERELMPLVRGYARYVHLLPATADNYFSKPGDLLRLGLETAFFSLQGTDGHIFSGRATITVRRQLEPRWRIATFVAGLCCELHRVLSHILVTSAAGDEWPAFLEPLDAWLQDRTVQRYFLRWRPGAAESRGLGLFALPHVVPLTVMQDMCEGNSIIVPQLLACVGGLALYREHNVLDDLVRRSLALVIDRDLRANADRYGAPQYGSHLERYLVDALRRLAGDNTAWVPNREKSRLWYGPDGLFLVWPGAAEDVQKLLEDDQLAGIPKASATMLDILLEARVLEAAADGQALWTIYPPGNKAGSGLAAVKVAEPAILFT